MRVSGTIGLGIAVIVRQLISFPLPPTQKSIWVLGHDGKVGSRFFGSFDNNGTWSSEGLGSLRVWLHSGLISIQELGIRWDSSVFMFTNGL